MLLSQHEVLEYHSDQACGSQDRVAYDCKINFRESSSWAQREARGTGVASSRQQKARESRVEGAEGPVSLPRDSNTRRIKPAGNQTFQYPCSCHIYAIKRPLAVPRRLFFFTIRFFSLSLFLVSFPACSPKANSVSIAMYTHLHAGGPVIEQSVNSRRGCRI